MNRGYTLLWRKTWANPLLCGCGKKFSRLEAGLCRGEFRISVRRLAALWNWSPAAAFRFLRLLEGNRMISRVEH